MPIQEKRSPVSHGIPAACRTTSRSTRAAAAESGAPSAGRVGYPSRPAVLYATVEAEETALYRSDDLGASWIKTDDSMNVQMRPFYFSELVVDPTDHNRVYKPGFTLTLSTDGGDTFSSLFGAGLTFFAGSGFGASGVSACTCGDSGSGSGAGCLLPQPSTNGETRTKLATRLNTLLRSLAVPMLPPRFAYAARTRRG